MPALRKRVTRRRLLVAGAALTAGALATTSLRRQGARLPSGFLWSLPADRRRAARPILRELPGVSLSGDALVQWFDAREEASGRPMGQPGARRARGLARQLLCSTDFFQTGMDPERPARFQVLWDPHLSPCYNPFRG